MNLRQLLLDARPVRCVEGRLWRHDPQHDDPYLETDIGQCPDCKGRGCDELVETTGGQPCVLCGENPHSHLCPEPAREAAAIHSSEGETR